MPSIRRKTCEKSVRIKYASNVSFESGRKGEKCSDIYFIIFFFLPFLGGKTHNRNEQGKTLAAYTEEIKRFVLETISLKAIFGLLAIKNKVVFLGW